MIREAKAIEKMRQESSTSKQGLIDPIGDYYKRKEYHLARNNGI